MNNLPLQMDNLAVLKEYFSDLKEYLSGLKEYLPVLEECLAVPKNSFRLRLDFRSAQIDSLARVRDSFRRRMAPPFVASAVESGLRHLRDLPETRKSHSLEW